LQAAAVEASGERVEPGGGRVEIQVSIAAELTGADVAAPEGVGNRLDPGDGGLDLVGVGVQCPSAEELDLDHAQPGVGQHGPHSGDVQACGVGAGQAVGVQPDAGKARHGGRPTAFGEREAGLLGESGAAEVKKLATSS
jgi:hypothetical protein